MGTNMKVPTIDPAYTHIDTYICIHTHTHIHTHQRHTDMGQAREQQEVERGWMREHLAVRARACARERYSEDRDTETTYTERERP